MLGCLVVNPDDRLHVKRGDFVSRESVLQLSNSGTNSALGAPLAAVCFRDGNPNLEASNPLNGITDGEVHHRSYRLALKTHIGEPWLAIGVIEVHKKFWINLSTLQIYFTINKSLLERLQRIEWVCHSCQELSPECRA
ncbi:hypothetical protein SAMN05444169_5924 [Bradyrhizobium erythrophlei]|uniref:Uncharacterized protein n=1 Tax=Bradyrhizobium erythrophlei TaxID=1437360 RepID=A0A1M5QH48_9BRAD|nr:hypothetical protein SAMN05444169_5924 [Bradyrhizobium erythrophlei]